MHVKCYNYVIVTLTTNGIKLFTFVNGNVLSLNNNILIIFGFLICVSYMRHSQVKFIMACVIVMHI